MPTRLSRRTLSVLCLLALGHAHPGWAQGSDFPSRPITIVVPYPAGGIVDAITRGGYLGIALLMAIENIFPPIPSEVIMGVGGVLVARGDMAFWPLLLWGTLLYVLATVASAYVVTMEQLNALRTQSKDPYIDARDFYLRRRQAEIDALRGQVQYPDGELPFVNPGTGRSVIVPVTPIVPMWMGSTVAGAVMGQAIPPEFALDFAVPITFLAMTAPMIRTAAHGVAGVVSVGLVLALGWMPYGTGLLVAAAVGMASGALVEVWTGRRRAAA